MNSESRIQNSEPSGFDQFGQDGFQILTGVLNSIECDSLACELSALFEDQKACTNNKIGGIRNLLRTSPVVAQLATSPALKSIVAEGAGQKAFPVRAIFFDKTAETNWLVPWHQDLAIAVSERIETPGFGGWSVKDGVVHVHPPCEILESMVTLRLHLDDCDAGNGALKVIPGSHWRGKLTPSDISGWTEQTAFICEASKGDALLMRPLLLHASSPAQNPTHRRVLHIEYATTQLPNGLKWFNH